MKRVQQLYTTDIEPHAATFQRLSQRLLQKTVRDGVHEAMCTIDASYTRGCARRFLSHYMVYHYPTDVVGDTGEPSQRVVAAAQALFRTHRATDDATAWCEAFRVYATCFAEWQRWDKAHLARTYRDVYRLLSEIALASPVADVQEPVERLKRTLDRQTAQIFGRPDASPVRADAATPLVVGDGLPQLESHIHATLHDIYWSDLRHQLEHNSFDALCTVVEHVKTRMLAIGGTNPTKRDEIEACLDVAFLRNVLHVGMAQTQVKALLRYCLGFLRDYGQPCHDEALERLVATSESLYTPATAPHSVALLVELIREITRRTDALIDVVCALTRGDDRTTTTT